MHSIGGTGLIRLEKPLNIVKAAIWSGRVKGVNPVSLLIVAAPESAKSQLLLHYRDTPTLKYFSDVTSKPLIALRPEIEAYRIRHIVLQDLSALATHKSWVSDHVFAILAMLMEEGATTFADPSGFVVWQNLPKVGILAALTPENYRDRRTKWHRLGFISRFLGVHFTYEERTIDLIHNQIKQGHTLPVARAEPLPNEAVAVELPLKVADALSEQARLIAERYETYGFRFHKQLRALISGLALSEGRTVVTADDLSEVITWLPFFNESKPAVI